MPPDRHELAHLVAVGVPTWRIIHWNAEFAFQNRNKPITKYDGYCSVDPNPTGFPELFDVN
jgi:hypothetical protein